MTEELFEEGIILKSQNGFVEIKLEENTNCGECSAQLFCNPNTNSTRILSIKNNSEFKINDRVTIAILGRSLIGASLNLYLYPLLILITSIFIGTKLFINSIYQELYSFTLGLAFILIYYAIFFYLSKKLNMKQPEITILKSE